MAINLMLLPFALAAHRNQQLIRSLSESSYKRKMLQMAGVLTALCGAHAVAMMVFEKLSAKDALWLTMTTVSTTGYGDLSAKTDLGRFSTMGLLYVAGITALAQTASLFFEYRRERKEQIMNGKWRWHMNDHIVILNSPNEDSENYFKKMVGDLRKSALPIGKKPVLIVSQDQPTLSDDLRKLHVAHVTAPITEKTAFENSSVDKASVVIVLAKDDNDPMSDSLTFDLISRARDANPKATIIAEAVLDEDNRERFIKAGADHVIRPVRSHPELMARTLLAPGTETLMVDLFNSAGDEFMRYDVNLKGKWNEIACRIISEDIGTPLGYIGMDGKSVMNTRPGTEIEAKAILVVVREGNMKSPAQIQSLLATNAGPATTAFRPALKV